MTVMKTPASFRNRKGFTLMELMVAMAITVIIVTVLVSITSIAIDTWNRSRSELRAARQAKSMVDTMARDFESMVTRPGGKDPVSGKPFEWLVADSTQSNSATSGPLPSTNATNLFFFSAATDRYKGNIGGTDDLGGDVSGVGYELFWKDPIDRSGSVFKTFVLNRKLVDPKEAFDKLLGKPDLAGAFTATTKDIEDSDNFVCENLYQFTIAFHLLVPPTTAGGVAVPKIVTIGPSGTVKKISIKGDGIESPEDATLKTARLTAVEISLTVLSDTGVDQLRKRSFSGNQQAEFMSKHAYQYSKLVQVPGM
jgi:prepilin-type N-terminal cleavage/methylation domain-containing protein